MGNDTDRAAVRGIIQAGYGDATQTVLDDQVAGSVITGMRERGWTPTGDPTYRYGEVRSLLFATFGRERA